MPVWERLGENQLVHAIEDIKKARPKKVLLSAHDTCDYSIGRFQEELADSGIDVTGRESMYMFVCGKHIGRVQWKVCVSYSKRKDNVHFPWAIPSARSVPRHITYL